ncbi:hypothetical protein BaRGS_00014496 [Batillaria attramentaria]|uniref:Uncharacterized protein n=1 Tax=Batillaria attramentaria TaxID=370345 RepID=A0ABD0L516_9CAEN
MQFPSYSTVQKRVDIVLVTCYNVGILDAISQLQYCTERVDIVLVTCLHVGILDAVSQLQYCAERVDIVLVTCYMSAYWMQFPSYSTVQTCRYCTSLRVTCRHTGCSFPATVLYRTCRYCTRYVLHVGIRDAVSQLQYCTERVDIVLVTCYMSAYGMQFPSYSTVQNV